MADKNSLDKIKEKKKEWETTTLGESIKNTPEKKERFTNLSQKVIKRIYTSLEGDIDYLNDLGFPGKYPYTRGIYPTMYRAHPWTMREFAGFGTAEETNERLKYLLKQGETGLSIAFDLPTLLGRDSDDPLSEGEVGRCGVAIDTLADMEILFKTK